MLYNAKEKILKLDKMTCRYITFGKGDKPLVMIQGLNTNGIKGSSIPLALMYRLFSNEYKVYLFDRNEYFDEHTTIEMMAYDVIKAMDYLNISNAYILGVSQGGLIAQNIAILRPDLVKSLVLALTFSKNNSIVQDCITNWIELTQNKDYKALVKDMAIKMYSKQYLKQYQPFLPLLTLIQKPKDPLRFIAQCKSCLTNDTYDKLQYITCPTLVIGAKEDLIVGVQGSIEIQEKLNCQMYLYEHLGHAAYEEAKDFNRIVYNFFQES